MRLWVLACLLAVCLVVSNARPGDDKGKNNASPSDDKGKDKGGNGEVAKMSNDASESKNNKGNPVAAAALSVVASVGKPAPSTNTQKPSSGKSSKKSNEGDKSNKKSNKSNKSNDRSKSKSKSMSRSGSKKRSGNACNGGFNVFSFLKLFGLPRNNTEDPQDDAVCQEVSQCVLLAVGRLALRDCLGRLQEAGQTLEPSVPTGTDLDSQIAAVTTDLRACMALLDAPANTTQVPTQAGP